MVASNIQNHIENPLVLSGNPRKTIGLSRKPFNRNKEIIYKYAKELEDAECVILTNVQGKGNGFRIHLLDTYLLKKCIEQEVGTSERLI